MQRQPVFEIRVTFIIFTAVSVCLLVVLDICQERLRRSLSSDLHLTIQTITLDFLKRLSLLLLSL